MITKHEGFGYFEVPLSKKYPLSLSKKLTFAFASFGLNWSATPLHLQIHIFVVHLIVHLSGAAAQRNVWVYRLDFHQVA